jgi:ABC-type glycerol-3-phosphate transport system substrate-binding protein
VCSRFQSANPQVTVTILRHPAEDAYRLLHQWSSSEAWRPEVVVMSELWLEEFALSLEPLPEGAVKLLRTHASQSLRTRLSVGGDEVAVPWWIEPRVLFYWPRLTGEREWRPASWDAVMNRAAEVAIKRRVWGVGIPGEGPEAAQLFLEMLWSLGGSLQNAEGRFDLTTSSAEEAMNVVLRADAARACQPQLLTWSQAELEEAFVDRKLAMLVANASLEQELGTDDGEGYAVTALPAKQPFLSATMNCLVAFRGSEQVEAARTFLAFAASREGQAVIGEAGGFPFYADMARAGARTPAMRAAVEAMGDVRGLPHGEWHALVRAINHAFYAAVSGRRSVSRALEEAQVIFREALVKE